MKATFTKLVNFKAQPEEHEAWKEAAHQARMSFGKWARLQLNRGLDSSTVEPRLVEPTDAGSTPVPAPVKEKTTALAQELVERAVASKNNKCERRLPKGTFCKSCGRIHA